MDIPLTEFLRTFDRKSLADEVAGAVAKRNDLVKRFPVADWPLLPLERYALGTPTYKESFCYHMEYASYELGSIAGGSAEKHLIYWNGKTAGWKFESRYTSVELAWNAVRAGFVEALRLGSEGKFESIDAIPALGAARVLRAKFISLYFPDEILPVFSREHLLYYLDSLGVKAPDQDVRKTVTLGMQLSRKLAELPELKGWSNDELMKLLYRWNPPPPETRLLKIAPGEAAKFWNSDCLPQGIICVGWDDVGDLSAYANFQVFRDAFEKAYGDGYKGHQGTITRKAKEVWAIRDLGEGDLIAANNGIKEILAVGEVLEPGYVWDASRPEFRHTVKVKWDVNRGGTIAPVDKWATITVANVTGDLRKTILALDRSAQSKPPTNLEAADSKSLPQAKTMNPINLILYGPPGTGKTYKLQQLQADYVERPQPMDRGAWLESLVTDFGWRPVIAAAMDELGPTTVPAIREHELIKAKARQRQSDRNLSQRIWGYLQRHTPESVATVQFGIRAAPFIFTKSADSVWSLLPEWRSTDDESVDLAKLYRAGPTAVTPVIKRYRQVTFHPSFSYEDFVRGIRPVATGEDGRTEFRLVDGVFKQICDEARVNPTKRYALFIDEINRGNIAKIFGELITLIENDKRLRIAPDGVIVSGMAVHLSGGGGGDVAESPFGVPANLDLYGTMNTADRSIALLDIALRRRFEFLEMAPQYDKAVFPELVAGVDRAALLQRLNDRLEFLLDRDHRIGHAYLMKATTLADLQKAFANQIVPLLQEYFFDDLSKVAKILAGQDGMSKFVLQDTLRPEQLFPGTSRPVASKPRDRFVVTPAASWKEADFISIYAGEVKAVGGEETEES